MEEKTLEQEIQEGERVRQFLADPAVKGAFDRLEKRYVDEFRASETAEQREQVWAKMRAAADLRLELAITEDRGRLARAKKTMEERQAGRRRA